MRIDTCAERIRKGLTIRNMKAVELCSKTGIPKSAMSQYINNKFEPKQDRVYLIAKALDVSEAWLMGYDVPMERSENTSDPQSRTDAESNVIFLDEKNVYMVPLFESVSAGFGAVAANEILEYVPCYIQTESEAVDTLCIRVKGDSMFPKIEEGDIIQVQKQTSVDSGSIAVMLLDKTEGLVKKVIYDESSIELHSFNPMYPVMKFEGRDVLRLEVVGLVKKIIKNV